VEGKARPYNFYGPASLIKKNPKFKAIAQLYRINGTLHITVKDVVQKLKL